MDLATSKRKMLQYFAEYSVNGVLIPTDDNLDYTLLHNDFADAVQKEIAKQIKIPAVLKITRNPIPNQIGAEQGFELRQILPGDEYIVSANGSQSYYLEVDNVADIYIEENVGGTWTTLVTINNTEKSEFTPYKGNLTLSDTNNDVRIRFSGSYVYNIRNYALYKYLFPLDTDVPDYIPYVTYELPADFLEFDKIIQRTDPKIYQEMVNHRWEERKKIIIPYYETGSFDIKYFKLPTTIDNNSLDTVEYEVNIEAQELIPLKVAGLVILEEKPQIATRLFNMYETQLARLLDKPVTETVIVEAIFTVGG